MRYLLSREEAKKVDAYTIENIGIPSIVLMERAALEVEMELEKNIKDKKDKILCVCGTGNNGGDGIAVARILFQKGYNVTYHLLGEEEKASRDNKLQQEIARKIGVPCGNNPSLDEYTIIVDALFGIGLSRNLSATYMDYIEEINEKVPFVLSIDIPSGICSDTGKVMGAAIKATKTITFGYEKRGTFLYPGREYAGEVKVVDIGFSKDLEKNWNTFCYTNKDLKVNLPKREANSHKGTYGKVLVIAGSVNMAGACYFAASAAYATGVGIVKIITTKENRNILQEKIPEAVLVTYDPLELQESMERIIGEIKQATAIAIGPGLGQMGDAQKILDAVLAYSRVPTVVDADGLQLLAKKEEYITPYTSGRIQWKLPKNFILTPHIKEMSDLLHNKISTKEILDNLFFIADACKENANVLVLKDARTFVVQGSKKYINASGNNGMATAGSGDVLTGIILGLLGQNIEVYQAAMLGTYIHGLAGDMAKKKKGVYSMTARDLIAAMPEVFSLVNEEE